MKNYDIIIPKTKALDKNGRWYAIAKERGVNTTATLCICNIETNSIEEYFHFSHEHMDGFGALCYWLRLKGNKVPSPSHSGIKKPPYYLYPKLLLKSLSSLHQTPFPWKQRNNDALNLDINDILWKSFTEEQTQKILEKAKSEKSGINAYVLKTINDSTFNHLAKDDIDGRWIFPVYMRGHMKARDDIHNQSSYINLLANKNSTAKDLHQSIKTSLTNFDHFATLWGFIIGQLFGLRGMRYLSKKVSSKHYGLGTFSCLGHIPKALSVDKLNLRDEQVIIAVPPGTHNYPISVATIIYKNKLCMSFKIHPFILKDSSQSKIIFEEICSNLL
jgi:hypothetical protein